MFLIKCLLNFICCAGTTAIRADSAARNADNSICCIPCKCFLAVKDCYDHCNAEVGVENDSVQMAGAAPADVAMA